MLTGSSGLLGYYVSKELKNSKYDLSEICFSNKINHSMAVDLRNKEAVFDLLETVKPSLIIHAAALVDIEKCQNDIGLAYLSNVKMTKNLVDWINHKSQSTRLVFISTDQVYSGIIKINII